MVIKLMMEWIERLARGMGGGGRGVGGDVGISEAKREHADLRQY